MGNNCCSNRKDFETSFTESERTILKYLYHDLTGVHKAKGSTKFNKDTLKYVFQENPDMAIWIYNFMLKTSDSGNVDYEAFENALEVLIKDSKTFQLKEFRNYSTLDMLALLMLGDFTLKKEDLRQITISYIQAFDYMRNLLKVFQYKATVARQIDEFALKVVVDGCFNHALAQDGHDRIDWASFLRYIKDNLPYANRCLKAFFTAKFLPNQTDIALPDLSKPSQLLNRDFIGLLYLSNVYMSDINRLQLLYSSSYNGLSFDRLAQPLRNYNGSTYILLKVAPQQTGQRDDNFSIIGAFNRPGWRSDNAYNGDSDCHVFSLVPNFKNYFVYDKADDAHANYAYLKVGSGIGSGIGFGGTGNNDFRLWIDGTDFNKSYARSEDHVYGPGPLINGSDGYIKILNIEVWGLSSDANPPSVNTSVVTAGSSGVVYSQPQIPSQTNNPNYYLDQALSQFENRLSKVEQERQSRSGLISLQSNPSNPGSTRIVENVQQESVKKSFASSSREFDDLGYGSTVSQKERQKRAVNNGDTYVSERKTFTSTRNVNVDLGVENMDRGRATYTETGNYYNPFKGEYKQNDPKLSRDQNGRTYINAFH